MAQHAAVAPLQRRDTATVIIQLQLHIPKDYRDQYPYPINYDAGNVARELLAQFQAGKLDIHELLEMADSISTNVTKPVGLK